MTKKRVLTLMVRHAIIEKVDGHVALLALGLEECATVDASAAPHMSGTRVTRVRTGGMRECWDQGYKCTYLRHA